MTRLWPILFFFFLVVVACGDKPQLAALCDDADDCGGFVCEAIGASAQGQCTRHCQGDDERCEEAFGEGACIVTCKLECSQDSDCPTGTGCYQEICRATCTDNADCVNSGTCSFGFCEVGE